MARIVFDLDGTLIDSAPDIGRAANRVLEAEGVAALSIAETRAFVGAGAPIFIERMRAARGLPDADQPRLLAAFLESYETAVELTTVFPGVEAALEALSDESHALGICTNKPESPCRNVLAHLGLAQRFACVIGGDTLPTRKPDPAPLRAAFEGLGGGLGGPMVYVGDSEVDAACAARLGAPFLLYTRGYRKAPISELPHFAAFDDFAALPALAAAAIDAQRDDAGAA